jgi:hypothetical protein
MATTEKVNQLAEAHAARHKLLTGTRVVKVTKDGMTVEYTSSSLGELNTYIQNLETIVNGVNKRRPPAGVRF